MFEYSILHWTSFLAAAIVLNLAPGPDIAFILGQTVRGGRRAGFAAMGGIWLGAFGHVLMAAAGLSVILAMSASMFLLVKWAGAAYLFYLGIKALLSDGSGFSGAPETIVPRAFLIFRQGIVVALLNPKVAVFFLAFLPQFVVAGAGPVWAQLFVHGILIIVVAGFIEPPLILAGDRLTGKLRHNPKFGLWLDRSLGVVLVGLGVRLALDER